MWQNIYICWRHITMHVVQMKHFFQTLSNILRMLKQCFLSTSRVVGAEQVLYGHNNYPSLKCQSVSNLQWATHVLKRRDRVNNHRTIHNNTLIIIFKLKGTWKELKVTFCSKAIKMSYYPTEHYSYYKRSLACGMVTGGGIKVFLRKKYCVRAS